MNNLLKPSVSFKDKAFIGKWVVLLSFVLISSHLRAQTYVSTPMTGTPAPGEYYSNSGITLSPGFSFTAQPGQSLHLYITSSVCTPLAVNQTVTLNSIITYIPRGPGLINPDNPANTTCQVRESIQYFDLLGQPLQTVSVKASPQGNDIVQPFAFDQFQRETYKYLPYPSTVNDGSYKSDALGSTSTSQAAFYNAPPATSGVTAIPYAFSQTNFEATPLKREIEQGAPGAPWQPYNGPVATSGHTEKIVYIQNNAIPLTDTANSMYVPYYRVTINADQSRTLSTSSSLTAYGAGQLYVTVKKDENWKSGRGGTTEEYKDMDGHLVLKRTYNYTAGTLQMLSTYYVYDDVGNLAFVLPPASGADSALPSQVVLDNLCYQYQYDGRNRLTRKKLPGKGWDYMVYNQLDQPVMTQDANQRVSNQWTVTKYDGKGRPIISGLWNDLNTPALSQQALQASVYAAAQWDARDYTNNVSANPTGYAISSYPALTTVLSVNYYDDYTAPGIPSTFQVPAGASTMTQGVLTATKTAVLNTLGNAAPDMLWTAHFYDDLGRQTITYTQHYLGGTVNSNNYDQVTTNYDFLNEVTDVTRQHHGVVGNNNITVTIADNYVYDYMGRKTQTFESINGAAPILLGQEDYNEIGQLKAKHLHSENNGANFLQDISYTYNERGWERTANTSANNTATNLLNLDIRYNTPDQNITQQFNGNIAELIYTGQNSGTKTFSYGYDPINRLTAAQTADNSLNETIAYDIMGNITHLTRSGARSADLSYSYYSLSNQLQTVLNSGNSFRSYGTYDANGNAPSDGTNKNITYNLLNLPQNVTQNGSVLAAYTYDANGQKLRNTGSDGSWDYISGVVYHNGSIAFITTEEGRAKPNGSSYNYQYDLKDHLGDVRVTFDKNASSGQAEVIQEDEYYAFGLRFNRYDNSNTNRYLYNGKEVQTDLTDQYDYGARFYDPVIGRWTSIDPLAEKMTRFTPYNYAVDNPLRFIDVDGRDTAQRNAAIRTAQTWVKANDNGKGNTYKLGAKGDDPGSKIDCSGLVTKEVQAGGEKDPNQGNSNGVTNIDNTLPDVDPANVVPGNLVALNGDTHIGIITLVQRDKDGNITNEQMIDSGGDPTSGKSGPRVSNLVVNGKATYWGKRIDSYKKFDTKPDAPSGQASSKAKGNTNNSNNNQSNAVTNFFKSLINAYMGHDVL